jgi:hypothetical protein
MRHQPSLHEHALGQRNSALWSVYDRGGPKHVLDVAKALREVYDPSWPSSLLRFLPTAKDGEDDDVGADAEDEDGDVDVDVDVQKSA